MTPIASRENARFQALRRLVEGERRRTAAARAWIEGTHLCQTYLDRFGPPVHCVLGVTGLKNPEIASLVARLDDAVCIVLDDALFRSLSVLEQGAGIAFVIAIPTPVMPEALCGPAVLIDRLQDPGNLGSILRTSAAAGIPIVYLGRGTVRAWSTKVLRAGMGAHFALAIVEDCVLEELITCAQVPVLATSPHAPVSLYDLSLAGNEAWIFGNEGQGIAPSLLARVQTVSIPQEGQSESLNAAAAAAVCIFEGVRQKAQLAKRRP